jgi:hypothetical protein
MYSTARNYISNDSRYSKIYNYFLDTTDEISEINHIQNINSDGLTFLEDKNQKNTFKIINNSYLE